MTGPASQVVPYFWTVIFVATHGLDSSLEKRMGPVFITEPANQLNFLNNSGASVDCLVYGNPTPRVTWRMRDGSPAQDLPGLRQVLSNGTLVLWPFRPEQYRQDVHAAIYVCQASNPVGTIVSKDVHLRGVVKQYYEVQAYDEFVISGNTAVIRCHIPSFVKDYVIVTSWVKDNVATIVSTTPEGGRYSVYSSGELHIRNVTQSDVSVNYRCQTRHKLSQGASVASSPGRLVVTDDSGTVPPRITDSRTTVAAFQGESVELPCAAQGFPVPRYSWHRYSGRNNSQLTKVVLEPRMTQYSGSLVFRQVQVADSGRYVCSVINSAGDERTEVFLTVTAHLTAHIKPPQQTVDVGKSAFFNCSYTGDPVISVTWLKDGRPLRVDGSRIKQVSWLLVSITQVQREDSGMYQCFVSNDLESAQAVAQLTLGDEEPVFHYVFLEETAQPSSFISLKCIASGNPVPQLHWTLDGTPLVDDQRVRIGDFITTQGQVVSYVNVSSVRVEDGGEYGCHASNTAGTVSHGARLNVFGTPYIRPMKDVSAVAGKSLVLRCHVSGHPIESITWSRGGSRLPLNRRQEVFPNGTLLIQDVQRGLDDGSYTCRAWNKQGQSASGTVRVQVMVRPVIEPFSFPRNLQEGMRARLVCTVIQGDPPFIIRWTKDARELDLDLGVVIRNEDFSSDLTFSSISPKHNGNYSCTVSNSAAAVSHTTALVVDVPPRWRVEPRDASVVAGSSVRLDCLAEGFPQPVITWERGSGNTPVHYVTIASGPHYEVYANGSLWIKNVQEQDGGYYLCQASNDIGSGLSKVVFLTVHVPPHFDTKFRSETVHKGEEVKLSCQASGDHPMTILWNIDKQPLSPADDPRYELKEEVGNKRMTSEIRISAAERRDSALFTCLVTNAFGHDDLNIRLIVQESPEPPRELQVLDQRSRSAKLSWSQPYNGNSAIIKYTVTCKSNEVEKEINVSVGSEETIATLRGLSPAQLYHCHVRAENSVGLGEPSESVAVKTLEEVPGGPPLDVSGEPTDSQSIKVTWKAPESSLWNGQIRGYYIGYKVYDSDDPYLYKTLEMGEEKIEQVTLTQLQKFTRYSILVQAYNSMGAGPRSDEIVVRTLEDVPSQAPLDVRCSATSSQSLHVTWEPPRPNAVHGVLQGYKVSYQDVEQEDEGTGEPQEKPVQGQEVRLTELQKYTNYSIRVSAYTQKGPGVPSDAVHCRTLEDVPGVPGDIKAIVLSADSILISWRKVAKPNGLINKYSLYWRNGVNGVRNVTVIRVAPSQLQYKVSGLKENSHHEFWLSASTGRGEGEPTRVVTQTTSRRVPARIINFGEELRTLPGDKVSMSCQTVGIQPIAREWKIRGEPLKKSDRIDTMPDGTAILRKLQAADSGNYTCHVENKNGADEIVYSLNVRALTYQQTQVKIISSMPTSVEIELPYSNGNVSVRGYEVHFKSERGGWQQRRLTGRHNHIAIDSLECGTRYQLYVVTYLAEGRAERSDSITFRTQGSAPIAPQREEMVSANSSHVTLHLSTWQNGGCPIIQMSVEYRPHTQNHWTLVNKHVSPDMQAHLVIPDLTPDTWYAVRVTAHNRAGSAVGEYDVITVSMPGDLGVHGGPASSASFFEDTTTLVSMASSGVVLIAGIVAVVCLFMYKRRRSTRHYRTDRDPATGRSGDVATTSSLMANMEKKGSRDPGRHTQLHGSQTHAQPPHGSQGHGQNHGQSGNNHGRDLPSYFSSPVRKVAPTNNAPAARAALNNSPSTSRNKRKPSGTDYEEEITPYATFRLPDSTKEGNENPSEEFKTFSLRHGEPSYMLKTSLDAPSSKREKEDIYHSQELFSYPVPNSHSLTSGSSNQDELMRAYEYARRHPLLAMQYDSLNNRDQSRTSGTATTESEATDPGIRQFSGTPPRPNERRQGACLTPGVNGRHSALVGSSTTIQSNESSSPGSSSEDTTPVNTPTGNRGLGLPFGGGMHKQARDRGRPTPWVADRGQRMRNQPPIVPKKVITKGIKKGLSSDESDSEGTLYTFACGAETATSVVGAGAGHRGSSGNELSEAECDRDRLARMARASAFARRPLLRSQNSNKNDIIDC